MNTERTNLLKAFSVLSLSLVTLTSSAQTPKNDSLVILKASSKYQRSSLHQKFWGPNYRKEWNTPVQVSTLDLEKFAGGLKPYQRGGGRQTLALRLRDNDGREYVLRSVDKSYGKALPEIYRGTFIESILNDQVSSANPYASLTIPPMANAAGVYNTSPQLFFVPRQNALDSFNNDYGNRLFMLEKRPDENWATADHFGNAENIVGTTRLFEKLNASPDNSVDQKAYIKARLFDMLIGDWSRHEDQWRWAEFKSNGKTIYKPVPRDRDQVYTKFEGMLLRVMISAADLGHLQSFDYQIKDVKSYNFPARNLDRRLANETSLNDWLVAAQQIQSALTDNVIEDAVKQLPAEVYQLSGSDITEKLKSRRDQLYGYANDYYRFIAKEIDITGTEGNEFFEIRRLNDQQTLVSIYKATNGRRDARPYYARIFNNYETGEIRVYGIGGKDTYEVSGDNNDAISLRLIGGKDHDIFIDKTTGNQGGVDVYDNPGTEIQGKAFRIHLSSDTLINKYEYASYEYDNGGVSPSIFYSFADKVYLGLGYETTKHKWRKSPFGSTHSLDIRYSLVQRAFSVGYAGLISQVAGKWNLSLTGNYDFIRWTNYYGLGNETIETGNRDYHILRTKEGLAQVGLQRPVGKHGSLALTTFYQMTKVIRDADRISGVENSHRTFLAKDPDDQGHFAGAGISYAFGVHDDELMPRKGFDISVGASYTKNLQNENAFARYTALTSLYIPLLKNVVLAVRSGGATLDGEAEFYQYNALGGNRSLRGFRRDRFRGETALFSGQELRWMFDVKSKLFNGRMALVGIYDIGRVWMAGEESDTWHNGFGGGIMIAPFNKMMVSVAYVKSVEGGRIHLRYTKPFYKISKQRLHE